jgi:membrane fusion protein (multidrug efflux system)
MFRLGFLWVAALATLGLIVAGAVKFSGSQVVAKQTYSQEATPVAAAPVGKEQFADLVEALGTANANESVTVTAKITNVITKLAFDSGELVRAGDVIAELNDAEASANLAVARATLAEAQRELNRSSQLSSRGVASQQSIDELNSNLQRAEAQVRTLEAQLADCVIRAPFAGVVGLRKASVGMLVRPGDTIATLDDISVIKLDFTVPERFLSVVTPGAKLEAQTAAFPGENFEGQISQVDTRIDPVTRSATVRAIISNPDRRLIPGMLMTVEVTREVREGLAAPELAVVRQGDATFVYVVEKRERGSVSARRNVTTGARHDGLVEITAGLKEGEMVVSNGVHRLRDGGPVVIKPDGPAGKTPEKVAAAAGQGT